MNVSHQGQKSTVDDGSLSQLFINPHFCDFFSRGQMISVEDCDFIKKFEVANTDEKQAILTNEGHQVSHLMSCNPYFELV